MVRRRWPVERYNGGRGARGPGAANHRRVDRAHQPRPPLLDAALALSRALAVETRLPEPGFLDEAVLPPLAAAWGVHAGTVREFLPNQARMAARPPRRSAHCWRPNARRMPRDHSAALTGLGCLMDDKPGASLADSLCPEFFRACSPAHARENNSFRRDGVPAAQHRCKRVWTGRGSVPSPACFMSTS